jgi:hypothetical protein
MVFVDRFHETDRIETVEITLGPHPDERAPKSGLPDLGT